MRMRHFLAPALAMLAAGAVAASAAAATAPYAQDTVIVRFKDGTTATSHSQARARVQATAARPLSRLSTGTERMSLPAGSSVGAAITVLRADPNVAYAEPDWVITKNATSNDPYVTGGSLWGMYGDASSPANAFGSQAAEAWAQGWTGSRDVAVGVIDEGIDFNHPDLSANVWTNPGDLANGVDDDGNGYVDDVHGWDFFSNDASVYDAGGDSHGTHVSGTIAGVGGNGIGVAGVNWAGTVISGKFLGPNGGYTSDAVRALDYMTALKKVKGVNIVATNNSWGGGGSSQAMLDAINRGGDADILFVAAAGNSAVDNDRTASFPSNYQCTTRFDTKAARGWDCVVAVAAITSSGARASYSNYGATTVDLGAPGSSIISTTPGNNYANYSGTSMATPHVSGAIALCESINPALDAASLRTRLISTVAPTASLAGVTTTGGRLDLGAMSAACSGAATMNPTPTPTPPAAFGKSAPSNGLTGVKSPTTLSWQASSGAVSYEVCASTSATSCTWRNVGTARSASVSAKTRTRVYWQVRAINADGTTAADTGTQWSYVTR